MLFSFDPPDPYFLYFSPADYPVCKLPIQFTESTEINRRLMKVSRSEFRLSARRDCETCHFVFGRLVHVLEKMRILDPRRMFIRNWNVVLDFNIHIFFI